MAQDISVSHNTQLVDVNDENDDEYVSDSNTESTLSNYEIQSEPGSDMDIDFETFDNDFTVPDVKNNPPKWTENVESITVPLFHFNGGPTLPESFNTNSKCLDYFKLFFTESLIDDIVKFTNQYAQIQIEKKHRTKPDYVDNEWSLDGSDNITQEELWAYFGSCIIMSVNPARQLRHIFSSDQYINNSGIRSVFTLKRFTKISNYLCVSDKSMEPPRDSEHFDKLYKIRPVVEQLNKLFPKYWHYSGHICVDEITVKMRSCDHVRQYLPQKPSKWGWKVWSCCDSDSPHSPYLLSFIPYLGKKYTKVSKYGLYFDVVNELTKPMRGSNVRLYTDSAYSSIRTFSYLKKHSIYSTGTVRMNSVGLHPSVKTPPKKMARGSHKIFQDENDRNISCCLWMDTKPVWFISTESDPTKFCSALRRVGGRYERISQSAIASNYSLFTKMSTSLIFCLHITQLQDEVIVRGNIYFPSAFKLQ